MKILLVSLHFVEYAIELAKALSENNTVHLILSRPRVAQTVGVDLDRLLEGNVPYTLLNKYSIKNPIILKNIWILVKLIHRFKPDVIHHQESRDPSNFFVLFFSKFIPTVGTVHDVNFHPGSKVKYYPLIIMLKKFIIMHLYKKIIVHGHALKNALTESLKRAPEDISVVPHGCLFSFQANAQDTAKKIEERYSVLFFGHMLKYKGLQYLIEAEPIISQSIPGFKLIVAGSGEDLTRNKHLIENNPHFEVHDRYIANDEVADFFNRAAVVVLPYIEASQSGIIAMAFAFGKPVITTYVGSLAEVVEDRKTGLLIPPLNALKLANAIIHLLGNEELRAKMGNEALKEAHTILSWNHIADSTHKVYKEALNAG